MPTLHVLRHLNSPPDLLGCKRHLEIAHAKRMQCIERGANDRGGSRDCAGFTATLGPERVVGAGLRFIALANQVRKVGRAWQRIVHERARQKLTACIVGAVFQQGLAGALRDAALDLTMNDHRVDHRADIVYRPVANEGNDAGFQINLQLAGMRAVAECEARRIINRSVL
jgi:hypothetical protein